jgi:hypothetical protein
LIRALDEAADLRPVNAGTPLHPTEYRLTWVFPLSWNMKIRREAVQMALDLFFQRHPHPRPS